MQNTLLLATSVGPFISYINEVPCERPDLPGQAAAGNGTCTDICPKPGNEWRPLTLACLWGVVVIVNAVGVGITLLYQVRAWTATADLQSIYTPSAFTGQAD